MSSVNSSDQYNGYYMKHLSDFEDELKNDNKRVQERAREQVDDLAKSYQENTRKNEERANANVDKIRESMEDNYARARENDRAELEKIRRTSYDRFGRDRTNEAETSKQKVDSLSKQLETERALGDRRVKESDEAGNRRSNQLAKDLETKFTNALESERASSSSAHSETREKAVAALNDQREQEVKKYEDLNRERMKEQRETRDRTMTVIEDADRDIKNAKQHMDRAVEQRLSKDHAVADRRIQENTTAERSSHARETSELRGTLRDLLTAESSYMKEKGQGRQDAIKEYEDGWRSREDMVQESHKLEINKLREDASRAEDHALSNNERNAKDRDVYFTELLSKKSKESREDQKALSGTYESAFKEMELSNRRERQYSQERLENASRAASTDRADALKNQALVYQKNIQDQRSLDQGTIQTLQKELQKKSSATDDQDISPAVENKVRRSLVKQYEKTLTAEIDRNKQEVDSLQRSYSDRLQLSREENQTEATTRNSQHQTERHQEQVRYQDHIQDTELNKEMAIRGAQSEHDRQLDQLNRSYAQQTMRQKNDTDSIIQTLRDEASTRIQATRQESDFAMKTQQRAFALRENELIRNYEKKLADQKTEHGTQIDNLKAESQQKVREAERNGKKNFDDSVRSYEQRLSQLETQHKERERIVTQNYEDELEKVRRSNALQQAKKG